MSAQDGLAPAGLYSTTLLSRVRAVSRETFWRRLLLWTAAVAFVSAAVRLTAPQDIVIPGKGALAITFAVGGCAGFGACVYCLARFFLCKEVRYLLASGAFSTLGSGSTLQAIADFRCAEPAVHGWIMTSAWLVSGVLFAGAAYSDSTWHRSSRVHSIEQLLTSAVTILAFPAVASPYAFDIKILYSLSSSEHRALLAYLIDTTAGLFALVFILLGLLGYYRRFQSQDDRMSGLICYFLVPCSFGLMFRTAAPARFDPWAHSGEMLLTGAWIVLIAGVAVENAFSHKESVDRLEELETLHEVSWSLVGAGTVRDLLNLFVCTLVEKMGAKIAAVYVSVNSGESLELAAACGSDEQIGKIGSTYALESEARFPGFHSGHTAKAFRTRETQVAQDVFVDVEFVPWRVIAVDDGCAASLPLAHGAKAIGVLNVYFGDRTKLTAQRLKLLATIAAAATPAIEQALADSPVLALPDDELPTAA